jgi:hypothetical protein
VVVITDNARCHHANLHAGWRARQEPDFALSHLPPYNPDLNPIERVWKLTRRLCLHNRYFPTLAGVLEAVEGQFECWKQPNETLRAFSGKTLRAAVLLPGTRVGSTVTAAEGMLRSRRLGPGQNPSPQDPFHF